MDKDRVIGSAKVIEENVNGAVAIGDAKLETEGKADKIKDEDRNVVGGVGVKDALRGE